MNKPFDAHRAPTNGLGATIKFPQRTLSGASGNDRATAKHLRCTTSGAAGDGLGTTIKYLRAVAGIGLSSMMK
jgi:hypothetical protein